MAQLLQFFPPFLEGLSKSIADVWNATWWVVLPLISFLLFWEFWVLYIRFRFIVAIKWVLLDIKIPKNILQTPKAMEQVFAAAHAPYSYGLRFMEKYWEGKVEYWMSFEMVSLGGDVHFYLRLPKQYRNLMESAIYAQYPSAEISEVEDYVRQAPKVLPNKTYDLWGMELVLLNPDPYPIRTYPMFEEAVEERRVDPVAMITEVMSKLKAEEQIWIQILARPTGSDWRKKGEELMDKMLGKEPKKKEGVFGFLSPGVSFQELARAPFEHPSVEAKKKKEDDKFRLLMLTPSEKEKVEGIERKTSKLGFETTIRFIYIDRRDSFSRDNVAAVQGAFRQFNTQNLNLLRPDKKTMTAAVHGLFKKTRLNWRRRLIFERYRDLVLNHKKPILNIEELATIYHIPITAVAAPQLSRVEAKKGGAPPTLPLVENE